MEPEDFPRELVRWMAAERVAGVGPLDLPGDAWERRLLVSLADHDARQQWLARVVDKNLGADRRRIAAMGAMGHPTHRPSRGQVPEWPDWSYRFHGKGCCLTHTDGTEIDVDFDRLGADRINAYFFENFLDSVASPTPLDARLKHPEPFGSAWKVDLEGLHLLGLLDGTSSFRLTELGHRWAAALGPVLHEVAAAPAGRHQRMALALGDFELACGDDAPPQSAAWRECERQALSTRGDRLEERLRQQQDAISLAALAVLDRERARGVVARILDEEPNPLSFTALEMVKAWGDPVPQDVLLTLARRASVDGCQRSFLREQSLELLMRAHRADTISPEVRLQTHAMLCAEGPAMAPATSMLLFLLEPDEGLVRLAHALGDDTLSVRQEATASLVVIGTPEATEVLRAADSEEARLGLALLRGDDLGIPSEPTVERTTMVVTDQALRNHPLDVVTYSWLPEEVIAEVESMRRRFGTLLERWWAS